MEEKMRKLILIGLAWLLMIFPWTIPAMAMVFFYADIYNVVAISSTH
jgi:hypothetical protein